MKALGPKSGGPTSGVGPKLGGPARGWVQNQGVLLEGGSTIGGSHFKLLIFFTTDGYQNTYFRVNITIESIRILVYCKTSRTSRGLYCF